MPYITPDKPKPKYKIHRCCAVCGRLMVIYLDENRIILGKHFLFFSLIDEGCGEYWECQDCAAKSDKQYFEDLREERYNDLEGEIGK